MQGPIPPGSALLIIDVQKAIDDPAWAAFGPRNNPDAEQTIARLLRFWRGNSLPVWHIRHDSTWPGSAYRPGQPGNDFKPEAEPLPGEPVIAKNTPCAFAGTDLEHRLRAAGIASLVVAGVITNNSVEATVRMAGCLGFDVYLVEDACFTFARKDWNGRRWRAEDVHALSLANLHGEYCTVISAGEALECLR
jgi:nicotinamidase-related amidase